MLSRNHQIFRAYIALARNERYDPPAEPYTSALKEASFIDGQYPTCELVWDEAADIGKVVYKVWGYSASEQFDRCIVAQPGRVANLLISVKLQQMFGDLTETPGFARGTFARDKVADIIAAKWKGKEIIGLNLYSARMLLKELERKAAA